MRGTIGGRLDRAAVPPLEISPSRRGPECACVVHERDVTTYGDGEARCPRQ